MQTVVILMHPQVTSKLVPALPFNHNITVIFSSGAVVVGTIDFVLTLRQGSTHHADPSMCKLVIYFFKCHVCFTFNKLMSLCLLNALANKSDDRVMTFMHL